MLRHGTALSGQTNVSFPYLKIDIESKQAFIINLLSMQFWLNLILLLIYRANPPSHNIKRK